MRSHRVASVGSASVSRLRSVEDTALTLIAEGQALLRRGQQHAGKEKFLAALDGLVRQYHAEIIGFCVNSLHGTGIDGEDIAQDVFLAAYETMPHFEARSSLRTWLYQIARYRCMHVWRDVTRRQKGLEQNQEIVKIHTCPEEEVPPEERLQYQEWLERVQSGLTKLKEADRVILNLTYMRELTTAEIAEILGITPQEVRTRRSRALQRLQMVVEHDEQ